MEIFGDFFPREAIILVLNEYPNDEWEFFQGRIFLRLSFQRPSSVFRVSFQSAHKKPIIMCTHENNAYWLGAMDQDVDSVWAMTLNCLGHNNVYSQ